jgi:hypothetical protein
MVVEALLVIAILGVLVWVLVTYVPMPQPFQVLIIVFAVLIVVLKYLLPLLGVKLP